MSPLLAGVAHGAPFTTDDLTGGSPTPTTLANVLAGEGVTVSNVTYVGAETAAGTFAGGSGIIDFDSGIVLSSGNIADIVGPNSQDATSVENGTPGDPDLDLLTQSSTMDAAVLEFDFVPNASNVSFSYVFGSEEYNEFVNSTFNDVFGFFVTAAGSTTKSNCAVLPDGPDENTEPDPVTINTINNGDPFGSTPNSHPELYRNNDPDDPAATIDTGMDGFTVTLVCEATVVAGQANHLKLAIADVSDSNYDSYVLLKTASLTTTPTPTLTVTKTGTGAGTVSSAPTGIDCGATCATTAPSGTSLTLTATAEPGSTFAGWTGGGCSGTGTCVVTLTGDTTVTATFAATPAIPIVSPQGAAGSLLAAGGVALLWRLRRRSVVPG